MRCKWVNTGKGFRNIPGTWKINAQYLLAMRYYLISLLLYTFDVFSVCGRRSFVAYWPWPGFSLNHMPAVTSALSISYKQAIELTKQTGLVTHCLWRILLMKHHDGHGHVNSAICLASGRCPVNICWMNRWIWQGSYYFLHFTYLFLIR